MKLSNQTKDILKNFATINSGIKVTEGNEIKTISAMKNVLARASVSEEFPQGFSIYNLQEFLGATSLLEDPDYEFNETNLSVSDSDSSMSYFYASDGMVITPDKMVTMPETEINFSITADLLSDLQKAASVLGVTDLILESDGTNLTLTVRDKKNTTSNAFSRIVGQGNGKKFEMYFKIENLKVLQGNYDVSVSSKGVSHFNNKDIDLEYFIALEPDSKYDI
jgi:hypothetical protein